MRITTNNPQDILDGAQVCAIVPDTNKRWRVGAPITFAQGRKPFAQAVCVKVQDIFIQDDNVYVDSLRLSEADVSLLALILGYTSDNHLIAHFCDTKKYPYQLHGQFRGKLIYWGEVTPL